MRFKQRHMVSSWMLPLTSTKALVLLEQRRRLARLNLPCFRQEDEYIEAMEQVGKGEVFCYYGANVYISAPSIQQLEIYKKEVINSALQYGLTFVEETSNLPFAFYIGLPQYASQRRFLLPLSTINNI